AARLSGFFTVIYSPVHEESDVAQLATLQSLIAEKDIDGWLVTSGSPSEAAIRKTAETRELVRSSFWRQFSEVVEEALLSQGPAKESRAAPAFIPEEVRTEAGEEGVRVA